MIWCIVQCCGHGKGGAVSSQFTEVHELSLVIKGKSRE